jgi:exosortase
MNVSLAEELNFRKAATVARLGTIGVLLVVTYLPVFADLHAKYAEIDSYYSHGYLVPLCSAYIIWRKRERLAALTVASSPVGLWVLAGGLLFYLTATLWYVNFASAFSMLVVLTGLTLYLFGLRATRELLVPFAFLGFMIPLPKISIIYITFWLKLLVASLAVHVIDAVGIPVLLDGAFITLPSGTLEVDNACSGLRSLIALMALGVVFAYLQPVSKVKKALIAVGAIPIAMVANLTRIVILIVVSDLYGPTGRTFEWTDFTTGLLVFALAVLGLAVMGKAARLWGGRRLSNPVAS